MFIYGFATKYQSIGFKAAFTQSINLDNPIC